MMVLNVQVLPINLILVITLVARSYIENGSHDRFFPYREGFLLFLLEWIGRRKMELENVEEERPFAVTWLERLFLALQEETDWYSVHFLLCCTSTSSFIEFFFSFFFFVFFLPPMF